MAQQPLKIHYSLLSRGVGHILSFLLLLFWQRQMHNADLFCFPEIEPWYHTIEVALIERDRHITYVVRQRLGIYEATPNLSSQTS